MGEWVWRLERGRGICVSGARGLSGMRRAMAGDIGKSWKCQKGQLQPEQGMKKVWNSRFHLIVNHDSIDVLL